MNAKPKEDLHINFCVVCEDIRREINKKVSLIGVYSSDILVKAFPANIALSFFVMASPQSKGEFEAEFRLVSKPLGNRAKREIVKMTTSLEVNDPSQRLGIPIPRLGLSFKEDEVVGLQYRTPGGRWKEITTFEVRKAGGDVVFA